MAAACGAVFPVLASVLLLTAATGLQSEERECAYFNNMPEAEPESGTVAELRGVVRENGTVLCRRGSRCFGAWSKTADGDLHLVNQGCWPYQQNCHSDRCLISATPSKIQGGYSFCCCNRDLCNINFTQAPPTADTPAPEVIKTNLGSRGQTGNPLKEVLIALVTVAVAAIVIVALFLGYRLMRGKQKLGLSSLDVVEAARSDSAVDLDELKLLELIGRGRYGTVYRGSLSERCVAVKLFSSANRQNFANERSIYALPLLQQHDNIARFLSAEERATADGRREFLILMEFYPHGSLSHFLSVHTVDWTSCCRMTHGVTRGLAYLHTELYRGDQYKPPVAHRDVTSRNVLVRADLSCVLADFGLSMRLTGGRPFRPGDDDTMAISEVGTVRYMAPEVLGGALNLRDCEAALKQVDVYALGLLYWETFRRCSTLFPGEPVPQYQLPFQAELGNHPSFEEMQVLVVREKYRPRLPDAWKENSLVLRSLKETMEDCWDQDAEARLTAQCAEERLAELTLLSTHTLNHRNLSQSSRPSHIGSSSCSYIEDLQVGVVRNLQGDGQSASVIRTTGGGSEAFEKNRNAINYERQQAQSQSRSSNQDSRVSANTPSILLCSISESEHTGGALPSVPVCLHLTEEDLEATKLDPKEVDKNLRETSDENLLEHSQKRFGSAEHQTSNLLYRQMLQPSEVTPQRELVGVSRMDPPLSSSIHPLPKQQNLPQRPTSLHIQPKSKETTSASSRMKLAKLKSNHRQVETGVAKMNTVAVASSVEPQKVTTVTNITNTRASVMAGNRLMVATTSCSAGVPTLVTKGAMGGGRTNPAGPQQEEEDKMEGGVIIGDDNHMNLLNPSPDEHEPLLRREQLPAESQPPPHHQQGRGGNILTGRGSNYNNNNNRMTFRADVKTQGAGVKAEEIPGPESRESRPISRADPEPQQQVGPYPPVINMERKDQLPAPAAVMAGCKHPAPSLEKSSGLSAPEVQGKDREDPGSPSYSPSEDVQAPEAHDLKAPSSGPAALVFTSKVSPSEIQDPQNPVLESHPVEPQDPETAALSGAVPRTWPGLQAGVLLRNQTGTAKTKRPERPCSLDLSTACTSTDDASLTDDGALSASGEKIKRRVKTPYTLKKWRPASWVVPTDMTFDPDFEFSTSGSSSSSAQIHFSDPLRAGSFGVPKINQSKSSMAVFLVGGGATATTTSEPDGLTHF